MYQKSEILRILFLIALEKNYNFDRRGKNLKTAISQVNLLVKITLHFVAVNFYTIRGF